MLDIKQIPVKKVSQDNVPGWVKDRYNKLFPDHPAPIWRKRLWYYEAMFEDNGQPTTVVINPLGGLRMIINQLSMQQVPDEISNFILLNYAGYKLVKALEIKKSNFTNFEIEISKDYKLSTLVFNQSYRLIGEKTMKMIN